VRAALFDIDGTLVDSNGLHVAAWRDAFAEFGHEVAPEAIREQVGKGGDQLMPVFLSDEDLAAHGEAIEKRRGEIFRERYLPDVRPIGGVRPLFERLRGQGVRIALASSAKREELEHHVRLLGVDDLVEAETSADDAERSKPHPDIFQAALERLGADPADAVVIGDTPYDAQAAQRAGVRSIGVLSGGFDEATLREAGCVEVHRDAAALLADFDRSLFAAR
jgi:HAD superfamily hydrolase (TIGR01509 family)